MVAAVIFSALVVSDLAVYAASQDRAVLYSEADASGSMYQRFSVLEAAGGADILVGAQSFLASSTFQCQSAASEVGRGIGGLSDAQASHGLEVAVRASLGGQGQGADNLSALRPLDGAAGGDLNIALYVTASGSAGPGVSFAKAEVHYAHLGLRLQAAVGRCEAAAAAVSGAFSRPLANCTSGAVESEAVGAVRGQAIAASREGFVLAVSYAVTAAPGCSVSYDVSLVQPAVQGLSSNFAVRFSESGQVTVALLAS